MLKYILFLFSLLLALNGRAQYFDTIALHYNIGVAQLNEKDKQILDSVVTHFGDRKMLIYSYADYLGGEKPNQHLSDNRATTVKEYLVRKGIQTNQILECTGLGQLPGSGSHDGDARSRRTDIFIRKLTIAQITKKEEVTKEEIKQQDSSGNVTTIDIGKLQVNDTLRLANIQFYQASTQVMPSSFAELNNLYQVMKSNPSLKIGLEGHVCCCFYPDGYVKGTPDWVLSEDRAYFVLRYLAKRGISTKRMSYKGFGRTRPIISNETTIEEGLVNRRVEIRILGK